MFVSGVAGRVFVNTVQLSVSNWSVDFRVDNIDVSVMNGSVWSDTIDGVPDFDIRFDAVYLPEENPFNALGANITVGYYAECIFWITHNGGVGADRWKFPNVLITDVTNEKGVRDTVRYSVMGKGSAYNNILHKATFPGFA